MNGADAGSVLDHVERSGSGVECDFVVVIVRQSGEVHENLCPHELAFVAALRGSGYGGRRVRGAGYG